MKRTRNVTIITLLAICTSVFLIYKYSSPDTHSVQTTDCLYPDSSRKFVKGCGTMVNESNFIQLEKETRPLAESGDPVYQYLLAGILLQLERYQESLYWMQMSADSGYSTAIAALPYYDHLLKNQPDPLD